MFRRKFIQTTEIVDHFCCKYIAATTDSMRGVLTDNSKFKLDGRHTIPRRKMSKNERILDTSENLNSSFIAIGSIDGIQDLKHVERNELLHHAGGNVEGGAESRKVHKSEAKFKKDDSQDARHWKELLLLHLDLIQQQREMLLSKDRQIKALSQEKDTLKCRLERMDRRMSLLRQQKFQSNGFPMTPQPSQGVAEEGGGGGTPSSTSSLRASRLKSALAGQKRKKAWLTPQNLNKRFASSAVATTTAPVVSDTDGDTPSRVSRHRSTSCSSNGTATPRKDTVQRQRRSDRHSHSDSTRSKRRSEAVTSQAVDRTSESSNEDPSSRVESERRRPSKEELLLRTDLLYYVPTFPQWVARPDTDNDGFVPTTSPAGGEEVAVPSWHYNRIQTGYQMEGTENLEDEIFLKRHQKPEGDERRRKRWDMQRLRERQQLEKLQQSHAEGRSNNTRDEEIDSFLPCVDKLTHIEVCDMVPVAVFGYPLPKLQTQEFSLPWFHGQGKKESAQSSSRTRNK